MIGKLSAIEEKAVREFKNILLERLGDNIKMIRLFGSKARGDFTPESDIDVLVLVKRGDFRLRDQIVDIAAGLLLKYEVLISPRVVTEDHFSYLKYLETAFVRNILKEGVNV